MGDGGDSAIPGQKANGGFGGGGGGGYQGGGGGGGYSGGGGGDGETAGGGGGGSYISSVASNTAIFAGTNGTPNGSGLAGLDGYISINGALFSYTGNIVDYVIGSTGLYSIAAAGAQGGSGDSSGDIGGFGALVSGDFTFTAGTELELIIAGAGLTGDFGSLYGGGGGGGSFVSVVQPQGAPAPLAGAGLLSFFGAGGVAARRRMKRLICAMLPSRSPLA